MVPSDDGTACSCRSDSRCTLVPAIECAWREQGAATPLRLQLEPGVHFVPHVQLDARIRVSHLSITTTQHGTSETSEDIDVWLQPTNATMPMISIAGNAPPVSFHGLGLRGLVFVNSSTLEWRHLIRDCLFNRSEAEDSVAVREVGGGVHIQAGLIVIESTNFTQLVAVDGGAVALTGSSATATISRSRFSANRASRRGGALFVSAGRLIMDHVIVAANEAGENGGGLYVDQGFVFMRHETVLINNTVMQDRCGMSLCGASFFVAAGNNASLFYALPAPPASYVTLTSDCRAESTRTNPELCDPKFSAHPELQDAIVAELLDEAYDGRFPLACPAGVYGRAGVIEHQRGNGCSGICPAGHRCPTQTAQPMACPPGTFCVAGSVRPEMCPGGTYSSIEMLRAAKGCHPVPAGFYAPHGSSKPIPCPNGGYRCPGARLSREEGAGAMPIRLGRSGLPEQVNTTVEITEVVMPLSVSFSADTASLDNVSRIIREVLGGHVGVPEDIISTDVQAASSRRLSADANTSLDLAVRFLAVPPLFSASEIQATLGLVNEQVMGNLLAENAEVPGITASRDGRPLATNQVNYTNSTFVEGVCPPGYWVRVPHLEASLPCLF